MKRIRLKSKVAKLRSFFTGNHHHHHHHRRHYTRNLHGNTTWMSPITHGSYLVQNGSDHESDTDRLDLDTIVVQREEIGNSEVWFYGVFDARIGNGIARHVQSQLFDKKPKESQMKEKSKEVILKAYSNARGTLPGEENGEKLKVGGSASVLVIGTQRIVLAHMGDYRAVVCKDGMAHQLQAKDNQGSRRYWPHRLISGAFRGLKRNRSKAMNSREIAVSTQRIDSGTEFIILASSGVWEVIKSQEAVSLIRHIDDAQEAAQCLAKEAFVRMSRSNISCLIIRFD